ncbi:MAG: hypothetical protein LLG06_05115 [Desulfobacteraceae bacterium]|nr:hypothetical protein [Desulfobacteraceae bacterium]
MGESGRRQFVGKPRWQEFFRTEHALAKTVAVAFPWNSAQYGDSRIFNTRSRCD